MSLLEITLLGPFTVQVDKAEIDHFSTAKARALLAYLAIEGHGPLERAHLAGLLWPDRIEESARSSLRNALSNLRKAVGDQDAEPPYLLTTRRTVQLNPDALVAGAIAIDVNQFQQLYKQYDASLQAVSQSAPSMAPQPELQAALEAIALYQGSFFDNDLFVDSPEFDTWAQLQREALHRQMAELLTKVTQQMMVLGNRSQAVQYAQTLVDHEPWREEAHSYLMHALWQNGQGDMAMRQYERCRLLLRDELDVEPSPDLLALYEAIRENRHEFQTTTIFPQPNAQPISSLQGLEAQGKNQEAALEQPEQDEQQDTQKEDTQKEDEPSAQHNIPLLLKPFFGREQELGEITKRLARPNCRQLTVIGPGGMGKTQLVLEFARRQIGNFPHGVWFVPLTNVADGEQIPTAIAQALDVGMLAAQDPMTAICDYLQDKSLLLILDNFEHLIPHATLVMDLLQQATDVTILVTSRERLNLQIESLLPLGGLDLPSWSSTHSNTFSNTFSSKPSTNQSKMMDEAILESSAVKFFVDCAQRASTSFVINHENQEGVVNICRLTDGMPLGIELAAVWTHVIPCDEIYKSLKGSMELLTTSMPDLPARHRCIRALFDDSWQQLTEAARELFAQLSLFSGGFDRLAMEAVADASLLTLVELVDHCFVRKVEGERYEIHELMRQFGYQKLAEFPRLEEEATARHAIYFAQLLHQSIDAMVGPQQAAVMEQIAGSMEDVRSAWRWLVLKRDVDHLRLALDGLYRFSQMRSLLFDDVQLLDSAAAALEQNMMDFATEESGDVADFEQLANAESLLAELVAYRAGSYYVRARYDEAQGMAQQALDLARKHELPIVTARANHVLGRVLAMSHIESARQCYHHAIDIFRQQSDQVGLAHLFISLSNLEYNQNNSQAMFDCAEQALTIARQINNPILTAYGLAATGMAEVTMHQYTNGRAKNLEALAISRKVGNKLLEAAFLNNLGLVSFYEGDFDMAYEKYQQAQIIHQRLTTNSWTEILFSDNMARCAIERGELEMALTLFRRNIERAKQGGEHTLWLRAHQGYATILLKQGHVARARTQLTPLLQDEKVAVNRLLQGYLVDLIGAILLAEERWVDAATVSYFIREHFAMQPGVLNHANRVLEEVETQIKPARMAQIEADVRKMEVRDVFEMFEFSCPTELLFRRSVP